MSNRALWNVRRRHEWLTTPLKAKRPKLRSRNRVGLEAAQARKAKPATSAEASQS